MREVSSPSRRSSSRRSQHEPRRAAAAPRPDARSGGRAPAARATTARAPAARPSNSSGHAPALDRAHDAAERGVADRHHARPSLGAQDRDARPRADHDALRRQVRRGRRPRAPARAIIAATLATRAPAVSTRAACYSPGPLMNRRFMLPAPAAAPEGGLGARLQAFFLRTWRGRILLARARRSGSSSSPASRCRASSARRRARCSAWAPLWYGFRVVRYVLRRLLWRIRTKLLVSYLFIAVVPVVLLSIFFLVAGVLFTGPRRLAPALDRGRPAGARPRPDGAHHALARAHRRDAARRAVEGRRGAPPRASRGWPRRAAA